MRCEGGGGDVFQGDGEGDGGVCGFEWKLRGDWIGLIFFGVDGIGEVRCGVVWCGEVR